MCLEKKSSKEALWDGPVGFLTSKCLLGQKQMPARNVDFWFNETNRIKVFKLP